METYLTGDKEEQAQKDDRAHESLGVPSKRGSLATVTLERGPPLDAIVILAMGTLSRRGWKFNKGPISLYNPIFGRSI